MIQQNFIPGHRITFMYTNWRGRRRQVTCIIEGFGFTYAGYHKGKWVMNGYDIDKQARRSYALDDIEVKTIEHG